MANEVKVRIGTPEDVHAVMALAEQGGEENGFVRFDLGKMLQNEIWPALNRHYGIIGVIGPVGGPLEGAVLLRVITTWYSNDPVIEERAIFVAPEYRSAKGGRAARLCEFSKKVAQELDMPLMIGVLSNSRTSGKIRLYERQFGPMAGAYFLFNAKTGEAGAVQ